MDYRRLKSKIRHFLLQQDPSYIESINANSAAPPVLAIAKSLDQSCLIGVRRLQKYLSEGDNAKDLSITVDDLRAFSQLAQQKISSFVAYLFSEEIDCNLTKWQQTLISFFEQVHLGLRRELTHRVFSSEDQRRNEELLALLLKVSQLEDKDIEVVRRVVDGLGKG
jgi:hypothetical protein